MSRPLECVGGPLDGEFRPCDLACSPDLRVWLDEPLVGWFARPHDAGPAELRIGIYLVRHWVHGDGLVRPVLVWQGEE